MTWLTPALAGIAAAIAIPSLLLLYFLKLRRRDVEISSTLLWKKAVQDLQANAPFQKLRRNILLLLQLLALAAVLIALAQPQFEGERATRGRHAIIIDRGASMRTLDGIDGDGLPGVTRLEEAKRRAIELVESLREPGILSGFGGDSSADEAMVVAFDNTAEVVQPFTSDRSLLRAAIESIEPSDARSLIDEPLRLVRAQAPRRTRVDERDGGIVELPPDSVGTIHVYSDGGVEGGGEVDLHPEDVIEYVAIGDEDAGNVGITAIDAKRQLRTPEEVSILVGLQSTAMAERTVAVELLIDGVSAAARSVTLPPAEMRSTSDEFGRAQERLSPATGGLEFRIERARGATIEARIADGSGLAPDAFDRDDRAWVVLPGAKRLRLALVTRGNLFLREGLGALPVERVEVFTPEGFAGIRDPFARFDAVVLDGWLPEPPEAAPFGLPQGGWLVFDAVPAGPEGLTDLGATGPTEIVDWFRDHPTLRGLTLSGVSIFEGRPVELPEGGAGTVIASTSEGPAIVALDSARTRVVCVPWSVAESTWGLDPSFIVFLGQAVRYVAEGGPGDALRASRPGDTRIEVLPRGVESAQLVKPDGERLAIPVDPTGRAVVGSLADAGLYALRWDGPPGPADESVDGDARRRFAVSLLDGGESNIRTAATLTIRANEIEGATAGGAAARAPKPVWPWLLVGALAILMVEWYVYNRKVQL
ncbi:MAG: VWA domain-containing protein [Planctomycetota bacterium]